MATVIHERRLSWHPRRENQFVVSGASQISLFDWSPETHQFNHIASQHDLQSLRVRTQKLTRQFNKNVDVFIQCFAWSPDHVYDDLVAVAYGSSKVDLLRLRAAKESYDDVLSSGPRVSLPVGRSARACNTLAFSPTAPNYLAAGLDKVRAEGSLVVWDLEVASTMLSTRRLQDQNDDRRVPVIYQLAPQETVTCVTFMPQSTGQLLAGMSQRWLRLFDLRKQGAVVDEVPSKVHAITTDPFDPHRIGCLSDGIVTIWDSRRLQIPLLTFTDKDASADGARVRPNTSYSELQFSPDRRGALVTLGKDANHLRLWDLIRADVPTVAPVPVRVEQPRERAKDITQPSKFSRLSWAPWKEKDNATPEPLGPSSIESVTVSTTYDLILANTRASKDFSRPISSFSVIPCTYQNTKAMPIMVVNREGGVELHSLHDIPLQQVWNARGDLSITSGGDCRVVMGSHDARAPPEPWDVEQKNQPFSDSRPAPERGERSPPPVQREVEAGLQANDQPGFGRGDQDGFPALGSAQPSLSRNQSRRESSLTRTRHMKGRTFSPASMRRIPIDRLGPPDPNFNDPFGSSTTRVGRRNLSVEPPGRAGRGLTDDERDDDLRDRTITHPPTTPNLATGAITGDISMIMRRRAIRGYGMNNPSHNASIVQDDPVLDWDDRWSSSLVEMWKWIQHSRQLLAPGTSKIHGFDFAHQGVLGIWEGLELAPPTPVAEDSEMMTVPNSPTGVGPDFNGALSPRSLQQHQTMPIGFGNGAGGRALPDTVYGDFNAAVKGIISRKRVDRSWAPKVTTGPHKVAQRRVAVALCGWSLGDDELARQIRKWENAGKVSQAACWMVFTNRASRAVDLLMRSSDDSHTMVSGMLAALINQPEPSRGSSSRQHWEGIIRKLNDPYIRAMLIYVALGSWSEVLREGEIPLRERLAIAFRFLEDGALTTYLRLIKDGLRSSGDLEGLVITGLTPAGMDVIQGYVDRTGDVQTAAIVSSYACARYKDTRADRWLEAYRDLLDGWKLFHYRCQLDIERGRLLRDGYQDGEVVTFDWLPEPQVLLRCGYCNQVVNPQTPSDGLDHRRRATVCPTCARSLPRCTICLMNISVLPDTTRNIKLAESPLTDTIDEAVVFCQSCRHGGHASHILDWFFGEEGERSHGVCAVASCNCRCADEL